jgi:NTE family protein
MGKFKIGLALGGGAARGLSHIGVLQELLEADIKPDVIAGTSMGAFVGGAYAAGKLEVVEIWAQKLTMLGFSALLDVGLTRGGVIDGQRVSDWLVELGMDQPIEALPVPFAAVATDLADGTEIWLREGSLAAAIRASISVPGILRPVLLDGRWLVDGGLVNQIPVSTCRALGANFVIAVNVTEGLLGQRQEKLRAGTAQNAERKRTARIAHILADLPEALRGPATYILPGLIKGGPETPAYFDVLANSLNIMQARMTHARMAADPPDVTIVPDVAALTMLDFDRSKEAVSAGRAAAKRATVTIRELIAR